MEPNNAFEKFILLKICLIKFNCASVLHIPIVHTHDVSKQIPREKKNSIGLKML